MNNMNGLAPDTQGIVVLAVDDVPGNLEVLGSILSQAGIKVAVATNGAQSLSVASAKPPDLILMDVNMPGMDGYSACARLKANPVTAEIPLIFLTAHGEESDIIKGFEAGGVDYVTKPFRPMELLARIRTHVELKRTKETILQQNQKLQDINARLAASEQSLKELLAMKDKFFSIIGHDLKNPVVAFRQVTELMLDPQYELNDKEKHEILVSMRDAAANLSALLENLIIWAMSQTKKISFNPAVNPVAPVAEEVIALLAFNAGRKNLKLVQGIKTDVTACFDKNMLSTIIRNLVSNAVKFTPESGSIRLNSQDRGDCLEISVTDTGPGLSRADIEKLFRIDKEAATIGSGSEKGTGLGLILCQEFVSRQGGRIWAESHPGKGATFYFTLPKTA